MLRVSAYDPPLLYGVFLLISPPPPLPHPLLPTLSGVVLGRLCSKIRPLCCAPMLPTTSDYALGWVLLCSINRLLCLEFDW